MFVTVILINQFPVQKTVSSPKTDFVPGPNFDYKTRLWSPKTGFGVEFMIKFLIFEDPDFNKNG